MPFPTWTPPVPDPAKPWTRPQDGDERRVPPPTSDAWWDAIDQGDVARVSAWLDGPKRYAYDDPRSALLNATNAQGFTALGWLVDQPSRAMAAVRLISLLIAGSSSPLDVGHVPYHRASPFWMALAHAQEPVARAMWDHLGPDRVMSPSWLVLAVEEGCDSIVVRRLLDWGVPVNDRAVGTGRTALHAVIDRWTQTRTTALLDTLLNAGADPRIKNTGQQSVVNLARWSVARHIGLEPVVQRLETLARQMDEREALHRALNEAGEVAPSDVPLRRPRL